MKHEDFQPGSQWRVLKTCSLEGRVFSHVGFGGGKFTPWTRKLKAGEVITCLGIKRHSQGVPALMWEAEAEDVVLKESMGMWASCLPLNGYVRRER